MVQKITLTLTAFLLVLAPAPGEAAIIAVAPADWTGLRSSAAGELVTGGEWARSSNNGLEVHWDIAFDGSLYRYAYTFTGAGRTAMVPALSHWLLEVSEPMTPGDFIGLNVPISEESPTTFVRGKGNPDMPGPLYGVKFDTVPTAGYTYTFQTAREPVWGDLYVKDGKKGGVFTTAWNTGFGSQPELTTTAFNDWVPRPDGGTHLPAPSSVLLLAGGLAALLGLWKRMTPRSPGSPDPPL